LARGTYISENLTKDQLKVMLLLDEEEVDLFSLEDLRELVDAPGIDVNEVVENLVHKKVLSRIERGKYCRAGFRDEKAIGCFLVPDGVVAYWSALNLHGLTEQFSNTIFVQTTRIKKEKVVFGVRYKFVTISATKRAGIIHRAYGSYRYALTDQEKTLVDCFDLPQYAGGYPELIRAFFTAEVSGEKLIRYCQAVNSIAVIKRMGFLAEFFEKPGLKDFIQYALSQVREAYNPFDPAGLDSGDYERKWRLRLNVSKEELQTIVEKLY
jgi:predicted transcriptional regulator of viral defense system